LSFPLTITDRAEPGQRIGLLGGSFNPAHQGHRHASLVALKRLQLDAVWWLVSPQNPLKPVAGMAPFAERFASAEAAVRDPRIKVSDLETRIGTRFTHDTLSFLVRRFPGVDFVWLMGADNLAGFHRWNRWEDIAKLMPFAVVARPGTRMPALSSPAGLRLARARVPERMAATLASRPAPAWCFLHARLDFTSATEIRAAREQAPKA